MTKINPAAMAVIEGCDKLNELRAKHHHGTALKSQPLTDQRNFRTIQNVWKEV